MRAHTAYTFCFPVLVWHSLWGAAHKNDNTKIDAASTKFVRFCDIKPVVPSQWFVNKCIWACSSPRQLLYIVSKASITSLMSNPPIFKDHNHDTSDKKFLYVGMRNSSKRSVPYEIFESTMCLTAWLISVDSWHILPFFLWNKAMLKSKKGLHYLALSFKILEPGHFNFTNDRKWIL